MSSRSSPGGASRPGGAGDGRHAGDAMEEELNEELRVARAGQGLLAAQPPVEESVREAREERRGVLHPQAPEIPRPRGAGQPRREARHVQLEAGLLRRDVLLSRRRPALDEDRHRLPAALGELELSAHEQLEALGEREPRRQRHVEGVEELALEQPEEPLDDRDLAREVGVQGGGRVARFARDLLHRGALEPLFRERAGRRLEDLDPRLLHTSLATLGLHASGQCSVTERAFKSSLTLIHRAGRTSRKDLPSGLTCRAGSPGPWP